MPKNSDHPVPGKRFHGGRWRIFWKWNYKQYSLPTRFTDKKKAADVDADLRLISAALAMDDPEFPNDYAAHPAAMEYLADRLAATDPTSLAFQDPTNWLSDYEKEIQQECAERWAANSMVILRKLAVVMGGIEMTTPDKVSSYLAEVAGKHSAATRNRTQSVFSRFFRWAVDTGRTRMNPMERIKRLTEPRTTDIVYCTPSERAEIIEYARETEWSEWLAVPLAFFSGMRREEGKTMDLMETIATIAADPDYRLHLEKRGDSYRVRYCRRQKGAVRQALAIPKNLAPRVKRLTRQSQRRHKHLVKAQRITAAMRRQEVRRVLKPHLNGLLEKVLTASPRGRIVHERIKQGFKRAVALGLDALEAYVALRPWEYQGERPGRPLKLI